MSMCVLGMAEEFKGKVGVNALWPRTVIATAAISMIGGDSMMKAARKPEIVADAAHVILTRDGKTCSGNFFMDDDVLTESGVSDLSGYAVDPGTELAPDFVLD